MNSIMKGTPIINAGQRTIQILGRISIKDLLEDNNLEIGDSVEVFIKKIVKEPCAVDLREIGRKKQ